MTKSRAGIAGVTIVASIVIFTCGAAVAQFLFPPRPPDSLVTRETVQTFNVETTSFDDARTVHVSFTLGPDLPLALPATGRLTDSTCSPGVTISSGSIAGHINGDTILAIHTNTPLWRSLTWADSGPDVQSLRDELILLGATIAETGAVDRPLLQALATILEPASPSQTQLNSVPLERIMWLPQREVTMVTCEVPLGSAVESGTTFGKVAAPLAAAQILDFPADLAPGARTLRVDGIMSQVNEIGSVTSPEALATLATSASIRKAGKSNEGEEAQLPGLLSLSEPTNVHAVPPATIFAIDGVNACLRDSQNDFAVRIIGSKLGKTFVVAADPQKQLPKTVDTPAAPSQKCNAS